MPVVWMLAILLNIPTFVVTASGGQMCVENFPNEKPKRAFYYTWAFATLSLPIIIMGYLYSRIISCLRSRVVPGSSSVVVSRSRNKVTLCHLCHLLDSFKNAFPNSQASWRERYSSIRDQSKRVVKFLHQSTGVHHSKSTIQKECRVIGVLQQEWSSSHTNIAIST